ncbi:hypothetical protein FB567DRAFT_544593 [Paraphoma chrysanthemicola]|uniref:Uncharacterized protein n=1 Tax=Paraphoma chrysanthemicola TaxID=798071 RepID=A0A8K0W2X4_9PLEO|nr:hypothetical protein FB567DRAFT_544593 [Paraphoma chrysanthemicola]
MREGLGSVITGYKWHCHACRDHRFQIEHVEPWNFAEDILRYSTRPVTRGQQLFTLNGGTEEHFVQPHSFKIRIANGIGRLCPCGGDLVGQQAPREYICIYLWSACNAE